MDYIEEIELFFADPHIKGSTKALISYLTFFGTKYISQDIAHSCGNLFDSPPAKFITLFAIFYQATDKISKALIFATIVTVFHNYMKRSVKCKKLEKNRYGEPEDV